MYEPNFNDPRVIKRCKRALGFAFGILGTKEEKQCHARSMDKYFGQGQTQISQYLKAQLLTPVDPHYQFGGEKSLCKTYKLNRTGALKLYSDISHNLTLTKQREYQLVIDTWEKEHLTELQSGNFEYKDKSNRSWHPLQNIKSEPRKQLFNKHGYSHIYDIKACAPTVIAHLANSYAVKQTITVKRMNNTFNNFLNNTAQFRQHIAETAGIEYSVAKKLINALFAGANLGCNTNYDTYKLLAYNYNSMRALQADSQLTELRTAIAKAWKLIQVGEDIELPKRKRMTSRKKWAVYFQYEKLIMDVIADYLDREYVRYFKEHDGWSCNVELDVDIVKEVVRYKTGINLEIEYEQFSDSTSTACQ